MGRCRWFGVLVHVVTLTLCIGPRDTLAAGSPSWWGRHVESISCVKPGYFVNPADCHSFYRCVDKSTWNKPALQRYDFTCPSGMVFDPAVSVCTKAGANGCADPWWPGSGEDSGKPPATDSRGGAENSLERFPSLFNQGQGGSRPAPGAGFGGKDPLDEDFGSISDGSVKPGTSDSPSFGSRPAVSRGPFGGNSGGKDPLDEDFGSIPDGNTKPGNSDSPSFGSRPAVSRGPFGGNSGSKDPLDEDFGSISDDNTKPGNSDSPSFGSRPGGLGGPFGGNSGGKDPLDADFGSNPSDNTRPGDSEFGSSARNSGSELDSSLDDFPSLFGSSSEKPGNSGSSGQFSQRDPLDTSSFSSPESSGSEEDSSNSSRNRKGGSGSKNPDNSNCGSRCGSSNEHGPDWWGSNSKPKPNGDRNDNPNSIEFDGWDSAVSPQNTNRPPANWGGASRPSNPSSSGDYSPWRPTGPWGSNELGTGNSPASSSIPQSPPPPPSSLQRPSWWDPPYAYPYQPGGPAPRPSSPVPTDPWTFAYRPRPQYPTYQIVAYPTWPPHYNRAPIIVVYSNSRK